MTQKFNAGDTGYLPSSLLPNGNAYPSSIYRTTVTQIQAKSVKVRLRDGTDSDWLASSKLHANLGIAIITIGDFDTEETLLNPLAKSILQFSRLLLDDSSVTAIRIRAIGELSAWWSKNQAAYSHIVFIGHGSPTDINFAYGGQRTPTDFQRRVFSTNPSKKAFISCLPAIVRRKKTKPAEAGLVRISGPRLSGYADSDKARFGGLCFW